MNVVAEHVDHLAPEWTFAFGFSRMRCGMILLARSSSRRWIT